MGKVLNMTITYASSLANLCEVNSSFDTGVLRICYTGKNRNNSYLSKETIEKNIKSIYNCPIVCNYDRDTNTLGGHDIEMVHTDDGGLKIVNITQPVGVIPESARVWFEDCEDENGFVHEYLYADVLLWKRQEAYTKIKKDGITAHSMEITVKGGELIDGVYHINDFEFTAFALIGVEPCFESSALEVFSKCDFKQQLSEMMQDLKESFAMVNSLHKDDNIHSENSMKGGENMLKDKMKLAAKYGIDVNTLDFSIEDLSVEELTEKFEAMKNADKSDDNFALNSNVCDELARILSQEGVTRDWGECSRYHYADCDMESHEVYCWDINDWLLYGFIYSVDGDSITIDYESKKRKKYIIVDFDEGEQASPFATTFGLLENKLRSLAEVEAKFNTASTTITTMETELDELRQFKAAIENAAAKGERDKIFARFEDLAGVDAFEALREDCMKYDLETLEEKCFAIRGRNGSTTKFSLENNVPKLKVEKSDLSTEPYGGLFIKYADIDSN